MHVMGASVFRRPTATFGWWRRGDGCVRARVLWDKVGVVAPPIAGTLTWSIDAARIARSRRAGARVGVQVGSAEGARQAGAMLGSRFLASHEAATHPYDRAT